MIVQELNEQSWLRGFIVGWVKALARQVDTVTVLALEHHPTALPDNVRVLSMGKERGYGRLQELREFYCGLWQVIREVDVIFSHMTPRYVWLAAPLAIAFRKPQMLWFIHPRRNREIQLALWLSRWITTATPDSFPIPSPKVYALGHGIDSSIFHPLDTIPKAMPPQVLSVGRMTPIKRHDLFLTVANTLQAENIQFAIAGGAAAEGDLAYQDQLLAQQKAYGLSDHQFRLLGALDVQALVGQLRQSKLAVNLTPAGSFDKAALEAMLAGVPLLTTNPAFADLLHPYQDLLLVKDDPAAIAEAIRKVMALPSDKYQVMANQLRDNTLKAHSLDGLMARMVALMQAQRAKS